MRAASWLFGGLLCSCLFPGLAQAQAVPAGPVPGGVPGYGGYPYPYYGGMYYQDPYNGYLTGAASVINSQSQFMVSKQQQNLMIQQVDQAKMDTKKKALDTWLYERQMTPTNEEERQRDQQQQVMRALNNPPLTEILSGKSLNDLMPDIQGQLTQGIKGPVVSLDQSMLKQINVTTGIGDANAGLIKNTDRLTWPLTLRTLEPSSQAAKLRDQIDKLMGEGRQQAATGSQVDAGVLVSLNKAIKDMQMMLRAQVANLEPQQYIEGKRYLSDLSAAAESLQSDQAAKYLTGKYAARGNTVEELVQNMARDGLRFAPATPGDSNAYLALYNAVVSYDEAMHKGSFRIMNPSTIRTGSTMNTTPSPGGFSAPMARGR